MNNGRIPETGWIGGFHVKHGQTRGFRIGPMTLWIQRLENEWRIAHEDSLDPMDESLNLETETPEQSILETKNAVRFSFADDSEEITFSARLADRPVVTRSEYSLNVPAHEEVTAYVSTPLWMVISAGRKPKLLLEMPLYRPSDTFFGPSTLEGELCYASEAFYRLKLDNQPMLPHRAVTAVLVRNQSDKALSLDLIKLPAPNLSLYRIGENMFCTQDIVYTRTEGDDFASLDLRQKPGITKGPAGDKIKALLVSKPREKVTGNIVTRAFSSLFK